MEKFPFIYNYKTARAYYGPSLEDPRSQTTPYWIDRQQVDPYAESNPPSLAIAAAMVGGGAMASGFIPWGGERLWNKYVPFIRAIEEYSPGQILRTFQLSNFFSQFEKRSDLFFSPEDLAKNQTQAFYLTKTLDAGPGTWQRLMKEGLTYRGGKAYWGTSKEVALQYAGLITTPEGASQYFGSGFARTIGASEAFATRIGNKKIPYAHAFFAKEKPLAAFPEIVNPTIKGMPAQLIGARNLPQYISRQAGAWGTEWVSRFNRLLRAPFEMEPIRTVFEGAQSALYKLTGRKLELAVTEKAGLPMLGALTAKYGIGLGLIALGYETLDYLARESSILDDTLLSEGITPAIATLGIQANLAASRLAEVTGLHRYRELQEEIAPGSTSLQKLLAFPMIGAFGASIASYGMKTGIMAHNQIGGMTAIEARVAAEETMRTFGGTGKLAELGRAITQKSGWYSREDKLGALIRSISRPTEEGELYYKLAGKIGPTKLAAIAGAAIGTAAILPFVAGALIPSQRPEELEAIYSGGKEVPIRKGRWWEFGRCLIKSNTYETIDGQIKTSEEIEVGDYLRGRNADPVEVIGIYKRHHKGSVYLFSTAHDRDVITGTTGNHIIPVLRGGVVQEVEANQIQVNDYVEVPVKFLPEHDTTYVRPQDIVTDPVIVHNDRVFATQRNWFTGNLQKSGTSSIPETIGLDRDIGLLFGYFLAEGNISFNGGNPTLVETIHAKAEKWIVDDIIRICTTKLGVTPTVRFKTTGKLAKEGCWIVRICSAILAKLFRWLFYPGNYEAVYKSIPKLLMNGPKDFKEGLIDGYYRGDGHLDGGTRVISSARKHLLESIRLIALNLKQPCGIGPKEENGHAGKWRLRFYNPEATNPGSIFHEGRLFSRVRTIEVQDYDDTVYDFEVDHPDHLLQAGTFLVHNSPYEGAQIMYYRPHWYPRMLMRAREKSIWGEEEPSPLSKWLTKEFTYDLERQHYAERPYPITSVPFEDIPFVGPILAGTIGRFIKPPTLMHTEEWMSDKGVISSPPSYGQRIASEIGQEPGGTPLSPYGPEALTGEQIYRMTEMMGLPGFTMVSMKEKITGTSDLYNQFQQLESARRMAGFERYYWDLELGGLLGTTEAFRRLYPHRRREIPLYNPIRNTMPEWLPGAGDRSPDFLHGDPYTRVAEGELRLPGAGYEARFPELQGVAPKDYPLIHRWKILSDVAPYSESYGQHLQMVRSARKTRDWTEYQENIYQQTMEQIKRKKASRIELQEYKYMEPTGDIFGSTTHYAGEESSSLLAELNRQHAEQKEGEKGSVFDRFFGSYWELLAHNADTAWDNLTPISPGAKLVHVRSPIESYERTQVYGSSNAFWQHPVRDFLRPFTTQMARGLGWSSIPGHIERKREVEEYFDVLKYTKYSRLANIARFSGDSEATKEFESMKDETLFGVNPFTRNYTSIFRALPRRDRDYFNAFSAASTVEERQKIFELVPENERGLYVARWKMAFADEVKKAKEAGTLSDSQVEEADEMISDMYEEAKNEGFPSSKELFNEYLETRIPGETYPDWYRRTKLLPKYPAIPGPDWVAWHPSVDLEDIKLKVVQNMGEDMHDFNLWPSRLQDLAYKPYINQEAIEPIINPDKLTESEARARIDEVFASNGVIPSVFVRRSDSPSGDEIELNLEQSRETGRRGRY